MNGQEHLWWSTGCFASSRRQPPNRGEDQGFLNRTSDGSVASQRCCRKSSVKDGRDTIGIQRFAQNQNNHQWSGRHLAKGSHGPNASQQNPRGSPRTSQ